MTNKTNQVLKVPEELSGQRIDLALTSMLKDISRSKIKNAILSGRVMLNEEIVFKLNSKLLGGELIEITFIEEEVVETIPQKIDLDIVSEDDDFIIVNKTSDLVVHPGAGNKTNTLLNGLLFEFPELKKLPNHLIHEPWKINFLEEKSLNFSIKKNYIETIVDNTRSTRIAKETIWKIKKTSEARNIANQIVEKHASLGRR